ncbi:partial Pyridinium-3,5-biscarboxylic acid mononucleotide synthase, partial [Gammaproteobacteria bacterium]
MTDRMLHQLFARFKSGALTEDELLQHLSSRMYESLGFATVDHHREMRQGFPEVIFSEGKTPQQVAGIARAIVRRGSVLLATRASRAHFAAVKKVVRGARYDAEARTITGNASKVVAQGRGTILVVTAGTSDIPVAAEAVVTATVMGNEVASLFDVGVAGIHRILMQSQKLRQATVIIVVAGMEGALASVVGGMVDVPVIAVPTSVGYGANFRGVSALLGMLNSCASGVTVVNIDNGFG